ncbi:hypothetical protein NITLEN_10770 [Nitrospira lenta]|uniref:Uncharacterized protein n=1 Tax=Nitrospira lenta TaxID=1436998 RepID=A0A330L222_9BACT|nr:hypothetical protein NITLEN_10770 [Nitrospira lenta]
MMWSASRMRSGLQSWRSTAVQRPHALPGPTMSCTGSEAATGVLVGKIDDSDPAEMLMGRDLSVKE